MKPLESIFNPIDDSLKERVQAYHHVCQSYLLWTSSKRMANSADYKDIIGTLNEENDAIKVISLSLDTAMRAVTKDDLEIASGRGLLTDQQRLDIVESIRLYKVRNARSDNSRKSSEYQKFDR